MDSTAARLRNTMYQSIIGIFIGLLLIVAKLIIKKRGASNTTIVRIYTVVSIIICVVSLFWVYLRYSMSKII